MLFRSFLGWVRAGQTFTLANQWVPDTQNGYAWGLNDTFLVVQNRIQFTNGGYRQMQIQAVRI